MDRLILATTGNVFKHLRFPADESIQRDGWDGVCEQDASKTIPWLPVGVSGWELATQRQNLSSKANDDYKKRTSNPLGLKPRNSTFVFATLRSWNKGAEWAKTKKAEGVWSQIMVLDSNDLVHWIELYPPSATGWPPTWENFPSDYCLLKTSGKNGVRQQNGLSTLKSS